MMQKRRPVKTTNIVGVVGVGMANTNHAHSDERAFRVVELAQGICVCLLRLFDVLSGFGE